MREIRFLLASILVLLTVFHLATCSNNQCDDGPANEIVEIRQHSSAFHNANAHLSGVVTSTFSIPFFRVYVLDDGTARPVLVKVALGATAPSRGTIVTLCATVHEIVNLNDEVKILVLEELNREEPQPVYGTHD